MPDLNDSSKEDPLPVGGALAADGYLEVQSVAGGTPALHSGAVALGKGLVTFGARKAYESLPFLMEFVEQ